LLSAVPARTRWLLAGLYQESETVKRKVYVAAGLVALGLAIVVSARLAAQNTPPRPATPATKVALINLSHVINSYDKFKNYKEEAKTAIKPYQDKDAKYKADGEKLAKEAQDPLTKPERREQIERQLKDLQRSVEDNKAEAQKTLGKRQEQQLSILYMDIHNVVTRYAQAHGYEMVLHFNDTTDSKDYWSAQNIARKMQAGGLMPMYYVGGLDISNNIIATLNASMKSSASAATGSTSGSTAGKQK
jgi:Skp family chaperone for outer membrane proteins